MEATSFDSDEELKVVTDEEKEASGPSEKSQEDSKEKSLLLQPAKIKEIVDQVTTNITGTLQTLIVSDRVVAAERNSNDWKRLCQLMANNPEIINSRMSMTESPATAFRQIGPDFTNLQKVNSCGNNVE